MNSAEEDGEEDHERCRDLIVVGVEEFVSPGDHHPPGIRIDLPEPGRVDHEGVADVLHAPASIVDPLDAVAVARLDREAQGIDVMPVRGFERAADESQSHGAVRETARVPRLDEREFSWLTPSTLVWLRVQVNTALRCDASGQAAVNRLCGFDD